MWGGVSLTYIILCRLRKMRLRWFCHVKRRDENRILRRAMELEVEGRRPVGRAKKTSSK